MKNKLQNEIIRNLKKLRLTEQYNLLQLVQQMDLRIPFQNRLIGFPSVMKDQAMQQIRSALVLGPEKIDF